MTSTFWAGRRVLVTGARGFLGDWLCQLLLDMGAQVYEGTSPSDRNPFYTHKQTDLKLLDILNPAQLDAVMGEVRPEIVYHLASIALVGENEARTAQVNVQGTKNVLEACRAHDVQTTTVASTTRVYEGNGFDAVDEDAPLRGVSAYDRSKVEAERFAIAFAKQYKMCINIARGTQTYGPRDYHLSRAVPKIITDLLQKGKVALYGDGSIARDFLYIKDAVRAYPLLAEASEKKNLCGEAFNIATGQVITLRELAKRIIALSGTNAPLSFSGETDRTEKTQVIRIQKAGEVLDWRPKYTLDQGLSETLAWYRRYAGQLR